MPDSQATAIQPPLIVLVGNPNTGKTTLFNALTGLSQKVANYAGVTVEKKEGTCHDQHGKPMRVLDLPGAYSLSVRTPDEVIPRGVLLGRRAAGRDVGGRRVFFPLVRHGRRAGDGLLE